MAESLELIHRKYTSYSIWRLGMCSKRLLNGELVRFHKRDSTQQYLKGHNRDLFLQANSIVCKQYLQRMIPLIFETVLKWVSKYQSANSIKRLLTKRLKQTSIGELALSAVILCLFSCKNISVRDDIHKFWNLKWQNLGDMNFTKNSQPLRFFVCGRKAIVELNDWSLCGVLFSFVQRFLRKLTDAIAQITRQKLIPKLLKFRSNNEKIFSLVDYQSTFTEYERL